MTKPPKFERREHTTKGADPTVVVSYHSKELGLTITEFQGVYTYEFHGNIQMGDFLSRMVEALHCALESDHQLKELYNDMYSDRNEYLPTRKAQTEDFEEE